MSISTRLPFSPRCTGGRSPGCPRPASTGLRCCACITNFRTTEANIHQIVEEMNQLFQQGVGALKPEPQLR